MKKSVMYHGKTYESKSALADAYGLQPAACLARLKLGIPLERPVCSGNCSPCEYQGVRYWTLVDFAEAMGLSKENAKYLINTSGKWLEK